MIKVTTKGQVTIPKRLRDHLGIEFELADAAGVGAIFLSSP